MRYTLKGSRYELLFIIFISVITFCKAIGMESSNSVFIVMYGFGAILVLIKFLFEKHTLHECIILGFALAIGILDFFIGKTSTFLFTTLILIGMKNVKVNRFFYITFIIRAVTYVSILFLCLQNILPNNYILFYRSGIGLIKRYSFIFSHPNLAQSSFVILSIVGVYIFYEYYNLAIMFIIELANYYIYQLTYSRTGFLLLSIFLALTLFYKKFIKVQRIIAVILPYVPIAYFCISILLGLAYGKIEFIYKLDQVLTGRIYYINHILKFAPPLVGSNSYNQIVNIDNGFISLLYEGGILALCWVFIISFKSLKLLNKYNLRKEILLTFVFLTYCLTESYYMNILMNCSLVFFAYYIYYPDVKNKILCKECLKNGSYNFNPNL